MDDTHGVAAVMCFIVVLRRRHRSLGRIPGGAGRGRRSCDLCGVPTGTGLTGVAVKYCGLCGGCHGLPRGSPSEARSLSFWRYAWGGCHLCSHGLTAPP